MFILQTITKDLDKKKKIYAANVGRDARNFTHFHASMQDQTELDYLVWQIEGYSPQKSPRDNPGNRDVCRMGSKNGAVAA